MWAYKRLWTVRIITWLFYTVRGAFLGLFSTVRKQRIALEKQVFEYATGKRTELPDVVVQAIRLKPAVAELLEKLMEFADNTKFTQLLIVVKLIKILVALIT
jgi:hypothetical protein